MSELIESVEDVVRIPLPVDEEYVIRKHRLKSSDGSGQKRICIVTGIHGDELEGQYVCFELARRIREKAQCLSGIVDIYPAMNPFGIDSITRGIPAFDLDMNRIFPGNMDGDMNEYMASRIVDELLGADLVIDIHASNIFLTEIPQIRINELNADTLVPIALHANMDLIWVHGASTVLESTLAYALNSRETNTLVVEMGVGMRITKEYGEQLTDGLFSLMKELGIWTGEAPTVRKPIVAYDAEGEDVCYLNAPCSGIYIKEKHHGSKVKCDEIVGKIINPLSGEVMAEIKAPEDGMIFTVREYPVVEDGSLMGRILREKVFMENLT
ncbi:MAG: succinylglutamate desuccinylase/aspartoacylase family protein [Butyrivibrio sp.]|uniref:M14 family metallopeptidase n=1 Tax=Butyrivibrio sp. TaxID=28121 RepID=UPI0025C13C3F|nr:M14 family metallopeptidase [Butyrivibrio sp.]MBQ6588555.1 succinylglutamate desuccinylase/aspartoacylase family protein [Butyrivibrio sp.]